MATKSAKAQTNPLFKEIHLEISALLNIGTLKKVRNAASMQRGSNAME
jgi:hypothetical protein